MATSNINDYVLEIGWNGTQVVNGLNDLEKRIKRLTEPTGVNNPKSTSKRDSENLGQEIILDRKLTMLKTAEAKARSIKKTLMGLDMGAKGAGAARKTLQADLAAIEAYKDGLSSMTIKTRSELRAQRRVWIQLEDKIEDSRMQILKANKSLGFLKTTMRGAIKSFGTMAIASIGAYAAIGAVGQLYTASKEWENLTIQMQASFGSAEAGAERMSFLVGKSKELGVSVTALADGYAKIGVAARMSNVATEDSENIFLAAAEASRAFGLSTDDTQGVMRAFSQMMGKGQVMMEELKLQLGDRMPSAMGIFAKSMGKTVPEFMKLVETGVVGNKELANFATYLRKDIRESGAYEKSLKSLEAAQTNFNTALAFAGNAFMSGSVTDVMKETLSWLTDTFGGSERFFAMLGDMLGSALRVALKFLQVALFPIIHAMKGLSLLYKEFERVSLVKDEDLHKLNKVEMILKFIIGSFKDLGHLVDFIGMKLDHTFSGGYLARDGALSHFWDLLDYLTGNDTRTGSQKIHGIFKDVEDEASAGTMKQVFKNLWEAISTGSMSPLKGNVKNIKDKKFEEAAKKRSKEIDQARSQVSINTLTITSEANESPVQFQKKMDLVLAGAMPPSAADYITV